MSLMPGPRTQIALASQFRRENYRPTEWAAQGSRATPPLSILAQ